MCGGVAEGGLPELAADFHLAGGGEGGAGDGEFADHGLGAEEDFIAATMSRVALKARRKEMAAKPRPAAMARAGVDALGGIG